MRPAAAGHRRRYHHSCPAQPGDREDGQTGGHPGTHRNHEPTLSLAVLQYPAEAVPQAFTLSRGAVESAAAETIGRETTVLPRRDQRLLRAEQDNPARTR